jgi:DNA-binding transcriptional regulator YiaG
VTVPDRAPNVTAENIAALRQRLKQSQLGFALLMSVSEETARGWECGRQRPTGAALRLMQIYAARPEVVEFVTNAIGESRARGVS